MHSDTIGHPQYTKVCGLVGKEKRCNNKSNFKAVKIMNFGDAKTVQKRQFSFENKDDYFELFVQDIA